MSKKTKDKGNGKVEKKPQGPRKRFGDILKPEQIAELQRSHDDFRGRLARGETITVNGDVGFMLGNDAVKGTFNTKGEKAMIEKKDK